MDHDDANLNDTFLLCKSRARSSNACAGAEWKKVRTILNPSFTAAKMKMMTQIVNSCTDQMLEVLEDSVTKRAVVDMFKVSQGLSLDVIAKCALAWQVCKSSSFRKLILVANALCPLSEDPSVELYGGAPESHYSRETLPLALVIRTCV